MASGAKDLRKLRRESERQGWRWVEKKDGWMVMSPDGVTKVTIHKTTSDSQHSLENAISEMRKGGFVWKGH